MQTISSSLHHCDDQLTNRVPLPFFDYDSSETGLPDIPALRERTRAKIVAHTAKFDNYRKEHKKASVKARASAQTKIRKSMLIARSKAQQFAALSAIDHSIFKERLTDHLHRSSRRIEDEIRKSRENASRALLENVTTDLVKDAVIRSQVSLRDRSITLRNEIEASADMIRRQKHYIRKEFAESIKALHDAIDYNEAAVKSKKSTIIVSASNTKKSLELARQSMIKGRDDFQSKIAESALNLQGASLRAAETLKGKRMKRGSQFIALERQLEPVGLKTFGSKVTNARTQFENELSERRSAISEHGSRVAALGESSERQMRSNILNSRKNYELEVRFARHNMSASAKNFRIRGNQVVQKLSEARVAEIKRARTRRKVKSIRNALLMIRTIH